jgi:hypothetical protein
MTNQLPYRPSVEHLKKQARDLVLGHKSGDPGVCATLKFLHEFADAADDTVLATPLTRTKAQLALALSYGFGSWNELRTHVLELTPWDNIEHKGGPDRPELIIGNEVRFRTAEPAPEDLDAFTFFWLHPGMECFETRITWSVLLPNGREHVMSNDLFGAAGTSTRSDYWIDHPTGNPHQFRGQHITEIFRSDDGRMRFGNAKNYRFVFYRADRAGQINWNRPYHEVEAAIDWRTDDGLDA